jgi:predicted TIM-barrel fold metal-dependent hydrolase
MDNYANIFDRERSGEGGPSLTLDEFAEMIGKAGVERSVVGTAALPNAQTAWVVRSRPDRFIGFARVSPWDGMRAVRELERLVREEGLVGMAVAALTETIPASDARYYPLYAKCVELGIPARIYSSMNYATDRAYDLGHPKHLDQVCVDFPELTVIGGLGGWPWVNEMVALVRRHPNLYVDTAAHRPRHFATPGSGWEMLLQYGNTLLQDKVMVGISWLTIGQSYETLINEYLDLPLKDVVKEKWLYDNAARLLKVD